MITEADIFRIAITNLQNLEPVLNEKISIKKEIMSRLIWIFNDDEKLAQTVYDYVLLGHKSYYSQLRDHFKGLEKSK